MTPRKKKGIGCIISGLVFVLVGIIFMVTQATPNWLNIVLAGIGWLGNTLGFILILPSDVT
jgi:hypothetical protein